MRSERGLNDFWGRRQIMLLRQDREECWGCLTTQVRSRPWHPRYTRTQHNSGVKNGSVLWVRPGLTFLAYSIDGQTGRDKRGSQKDNAAICVTEYGLSWFIGLQAIYTFAYYGDGLRWVVRNIYPFHTFKMAHHIHMKQVGWLRRYS